MTILLQCSNGLRHFVLAPAFKEPAGRRLDHDVAVAHTRLRQSLTGMIPVLCGVGHGDGRLRRDR